VREKSEVGKGRGTGDGRSFSRGRRTSYSLSLWERAGVRASVGMTPFIPEFAV